MRIHLVRSGTIQIYAKAHPASRQSFEDWLEKVKRTNWNQPGDICKVFRTADLLGSGSNRVIFDIGGNKYRMVCKYVFGEKQVHLFVCWIGTHAEYDKLCTLNQQYTINIY